MLKEPHKGWEFWIFKRFKLINNAEILKYIADKLLSHFSRVWLCDPIDGNPPGSPVPGILQARTLEWVAISFSNAWKWKVKVKSFSCVQPSATPWTAASMKCEGHSQYGKNSLCWEWIRGEGCRATIVALGKKDKRRKNFSFHPLN